MEVNKNELRLSAQAAVTTNTNVSACAHSGDWKGGKTMRFIYWKKFLLWNPGQPETPDPPASES